jgi:hypothetical protein
VASIDDRTGRGGGYRVRWRKPDHRMRSRTFARKSDAVAYAALSASTV